MTKIIDTADDVSGKLDALQREHGVTHVIRYYDRANGGDNWKQIHAPEARKIGDQGLNLGIVYEGPGATPSYFTKDHGIADGKWCVAKKDELGMPDNAAVYFAVDFDPSESQVDSIKEYFEGVHEALHGHHIRVGAYCSGAAAAAIKDLFPDTLVWLTCSLGFRGTRDAIKNKKFDLFQGTLAPLASGCDKELAGLSVDYNEQRDPKADVGFFVPFKGAGHVVGPHPPSPEEGAPPAPPHPDEPLPPPVWTQNTPVGVVHDVRWLQTVLRQKAGYQAGIDGDVGPQTIAAMIRYMEVVEHNA